MDRKSGNGHRPGNGNGNGSGGGNGHGNGHVPAEWEPGFHPAPAPYVPSSGQIQPVTEFEGGQEAIGLDDLWRLVRRQWWVVAASIVLAVGAAVFYTWRQVPQWQSSTLLRVATAGTSDPFASYTGGSWYEDELETEMRVVATSPIARSVVDSLDLTFGISKPAGLDRDAVFLSYELEAEPPSVSYRMVRTGADTYELESTAPEGMAVSRQFRAGTLVAIPGATFSVASDSALVARGVELPIEMSLFTRGTAAAAGAVLGGLSVTRPNPQASLFQISYRGPDRYLVPDIANRVAQAFLIQRREVRSTESRSTADFLEDQTQELLSQLEAAENELQSFREREQVVALEAEASTQVQRLAQLQTDHTQLSSERDALRNLLQSIRFDPVGAAPDYRKLVAFPSFIDNGTIQSYVESLTTAEQRRTELRARWKPDHPGIVALDAQIKELEGRIGQIGDDYLRSLNDQIASMDAVLVQFGSNLEKIPARELQYARLERQTKLLTDMYSMLETQKKQAQVSEAVEDPSARVVEPAVLPFAPVSPSPRRNMVFAGFLGLMGGLGLAFVREQMDKSIHSDDDVDEMLGVPVLSRVPSLQGLRKNGKGRRDALVAAGPDRSISAESFRNLRTNIMYARASRPTREIGITSPGPREGKSVTASNLAGTFAIQGRRTLLVDADMRRSVQHSIFKVDHSPGLSEYLTGQAKLADIIQATQVDNLDVISAGRHPPNPAELLGRTLFDTLIQYARETYDAIIFDTPPVLAVTDAAILGQKLDGMLLVVRADQTPRKAAQDTLKQLARVGAHVLGVVVNDAETSGQYGYDYSYYGPDPSSAPRWLPQRPRSSKVN